MLRVKGLLPTTDESLTRAVVLIGEFVPPDEAPPLRRLCGNMEEPLLVAGVEEWLREREVKPWMLALGGPEESSYWLPLPAERSGAQFTLWVLRW